MGSCLSMGVASWTREVCWGLREDFPLGLGLEALEQANIQASVFRAECPMLDAWVGKLVRGPAHTFQSSALLIIKSTSCVGW